MKLFVGVLSGSFILFMSAAFGAQYLMLSHDSTHTASDRSYRDALAIVFCMGQCGEAFATGFGLHYMCKSIITILTAGQSIEVIHASRLAAAAAGSPKAAGGASAGTTVVVLRIDAQAANGTAPTGPRSPHMASRTTHVSPERLEFAERLAEMRNRSTYEPSDTSHTHRICTARPYVIYH